MEFSLEEAVVYYKKQGAPADQSALLALLREVQQESGGAIPKTALPALAEGLGVRESYLLALIRRIPSLRLSDLHTLELCAGPNCGKHAALAACAEKRCKGKNIILKFTPCMGLCGKGPNLRWDGKLYHRADEALIRSLTEGKD